MDVIVVIANKFNRSAAFGLGIYPHIVSFLFEIGHKVDILGDGEIVVGRVDWIYSIVIYCPMGEVVACVGYGFQRAGLAIGVGACATDCASCLIVDCSSNFKVIHSRLG